MEVLDIAEFCKKTAFGTDKHQGIGHEANATGLVEDEPSLIDDRLILMVQECSIYTLLGEHRCVPSTIRGALKPAFDVLAQVLKQLFLDSRGRGGNGSRQGDRNTAA